MTSVVILGFVQTGIIPGIVEMSSKFELLFVNGAGLPFNTGALVHVLITISPSRLCHLLDASRKN